MMRRLVPFAVVPLLALAACGSDDESAGGGSGDWCDFATEIEASDNPLEDLDPTDPEGVEAALRDLESTLDDAVDAAPDEIRDDVSTVADAFGQLIDAFADANWNIMDADLSVIEELGTEIDEASARITAYNEEECGIEATDGTTADSEGATDDTSAEEGATETTSGFDPGEGTVREQLVESFVAGGFSQEEAECLAENIDLSDPDIASGDTTAFLEIFETCGIDMERLAELGESLGG